MVSVCWWGGEIDRREGKERVRTRHGPLALLHHRLNSLDQMRVRLADLLDLFTSVSTLDILGIGIKEGGRKTNTGGKRDTQDRTRAAERKNSVKHNTHAQILKWPCLLDVVEGRLEFREFLVDTLSGFFGFCDLYGCVVLTRVMRSKREERGKGGKEGNRRESEGKESEGREREGRESEGRASEGKESGRRKLRRKSKGENKEKQQEVERMQEGRRGNENKRSQNPR